MQRLVFADTDELSDGIDGELASLLPLRERERVFGIEDESLRKQSLLGAALVRAFTGDGDILYGEKGKPYKIASHEFNLSHSGKRAVLYFGDESAVGTDIERIRPIADGTAAKLFGEEEKAFADGRFSADVANIALWTIKEAAAKFGGSGVYSPRKQVATGISDDSFIFGGKRVYYKVYISDGYVITACAGVKVEATPERVDITEIIRLIKGGEKRRRI